MITILIVIITMIIKVVIIIIKIRIIVIIIIITNNMQAVLSVQRTQVTTKRRSSASRCMRSLPSIIWRETSGLVQANSMWP